MKQLRIRVSNSEKSQLMAMLMVVALAMTLLPLFINSKLPNLFPSRSLLTIASMGAVIEFVCIAVTVLYSRFSPIRSLRLRKQLIRFTEMLTKQVEDGKMKYSIAWRYKVYSDKTVIQFFSGGLVLDKRAVAKRLQEFLHLELLEYAEHNNYVQLILGTAPNPFNGIEVLLDDKL
ncbi:TPA: hypothetical protein J0T04_000308 [Enterococcus faecium]|uniref:hypothetical protein n=1 Tax=Enterococcus faecium TaxID=1352 RepID=UPI0022EBCC39|nr:hypothetical protein [Enterococcus faecium]HAZ0637585.1 hypothetical protein [Enterococcus faecium]HAZ1080074.1 hypothetical protein [Enterococcus faecium]HCQ8782895.1 hypothetical protein [Enterococcus faecium]HCZ8405398.1 hypothetical protein [Enterococcus faecium]